MERLGEHGEKFRFVERTDGLYTGRQSLRVSTVGMKLIF